MCLILASRCRGWPTLCTVTIFQCSTTRPLAEPQTIIVESIISLSMTQYYGNLGNSSDWLPKSHIINRPTWGELHRNGRKHPVFCPSNLKFFWRNSNVFMLFSHSLYNSLATTEERKHISVMYIIYLKSNKSYRIVYYILSVRIPANK